MNKPPETKTTTQMEAPPDWAIGLKGEIVRGFEQVEKRLDTIETNVDLQGGTVRDIQKRMTAQEERMNVMETRQNLSSERVKQTSQADLGHDAAIAEIRTTVAELKERPDLGQQVLDAAEAASKTPAGQKVIGGFVSLVVIFIALMTARLQAQLSHLEEKPAPVYQPDAGTR
jgi:uncharacterized coiled-coil protein SlyX